MEIYDRLFFYSSFYKETENPFLREEHDFIPKALRFVDDFSIEELSTKKENAIRFFAFLFSNLESEGYILWYKWKLHNYSVDTDFVDCFNNSRFFDLLCWSREDELEFDRHLYLSFLKSILYTRFDGEPAKLRGTYLNPKFSETLKKLYYFFNETRQLVETLKNKQNIFTESAEVGEMVASLDALSTEIDQNFISDGLDVTYQDGKRGTVFGNDIYEYVPGGNFISYRNKIAYFLSRYLQEEVKCDYKHRIIGNIFIWSNLAQCNEPEAEDFVDIHLCEQVQQWIDDGKNLVDQLEYEQNQI